MNGVPIVIGAGIDDEEADAMDAAIRAADVLEPELADERADDEAGGVGSRRDRHRAGQGRVIDAVAGGAADRVLHGQVGGGVAGAAYRRAVAGTRARGEIIAA